MKKEKYFKDELQHLFMVYAIFPAVVFTLVCAVVFMTALLYGKSSINRQKNEETAGNLNRILEGYEDSLEEMCALPMLFQSRELYARRSVFYENFYRTSNRLNYEAEFYLFDKKRNLLLSNREQIPEYLQIPAGTEWGVFKSMDEQPGSPVIRLMDAWKKQEGSIVLAQAAQMDGEVEGYLVFALSGRGMQGFLEQPETQTILTDRFGWTFYGANEGFLTDSNQIKEQLKEENRRFLNQGGHLYLVSRKPVYHRMFEVYTLSDIQNIVVSLTLGSALVITALGLMTGWLFMSSRKVTETKTRDLYRILDVMERARDGNLDETISIESENEFRIIADACNETIASLKVQMENNRKMAELVALSQNKQLESQFNPHFLYNTLENIRYMCKLEPVTAERMVFSLSNLLRYSLDSSKAEVTLKEDLEHLKNYLTILERRFGSRFSYQIEVEQEALSCRVPRLMLQPMIENAVKYGFGNQPNLRVELKAYIHEEKLTMICRDDGVGMSQTLLSELTALLEKEENTSRHSGLYNIHRRILLLYGRPYGVEIRSAEGHGTTLVVTLPAREQEDTNASGTDCGR